LGLNGGQESKGKKMKSVKKKRFHIPFRRRARRKKKGELRDLAYVFIAKKGLGHESRTRATKDTLPTPKRPGG